MVQRDNTTGRDGVDRLLARLARLNLTGVFLGVAALVIAALLLPGVIGGVLLLGLAVALGVLLRRTWPLHPPGVRLLRVAVLVLLVVIALARLTA